MSNILSFPTDRAARHNEAQTERKHRAQALRDRLREQPMLAPSVSERLAENLHGLLMRLEAAGRLRRADLCSRIFGSSREESTKRLRNFTLDPEKTGKARETALLALAKKANRYVKLAEAAAEMAGEDKDTTILDLVHGTPLANATAAAPADPLTADLRAPVLRALEHSARAIGERHRLQRAFKLIARYPERDQSPWPAALHDESAAVVAGPVKSELPYLEDGSMSPRLGEERSDWWRLVNRSPKILLGETVLASIDQVPQFTKRPWRSKETPPAPPMARFGAHRLNFGYLSTSASFPSDHSWSRGLVCFWNSCARSRLSARGCPSSSARYAACRRILPLKRRNVVRSWSGCANSSPGSGERRPPKPCIPSDVTILREQCDATLSSTTWMWLCPSNSLP